MACGHFLCIICFQVAIKRVFAYGTWDVYQMQHDVTESMIIAYKPLLGSLIWMGARHQPSQMIFGI